MVWVLHFYKVLPRPKVVQGIFSVAMTELASQQKISVAPTLQNKRNRGQEGSQKGPGAPGQH
jgi:hypothetical protein